MAGETDESAIQKSPLTLQSKDGTHTNDEVTPKQIGQQEDDGGTKRSQLEDGDSNPTQINKADDNQETDVESDEDDDGVKKKSGLGFTDYISLITSGYSLFSYLIDVGTDIDLVIDYKNRGLIGYFLATLACIVIPHLLLVITDLEMLWEDRRNWLAYQTQLKNQQQKEENRQEDVKLINDDSIEGNEECIEIIRNDENTAENTDNQSTDGTESGDANEKPKKNCCCFNFDFVQCSFTHDTGVYILRICIGLLGLGVIIRKLQRLYFKFKSIRAPNEAWKSWYEAKMLEAQRDSSNLAFICAFTENCPQSLLQLYIYVKSPVALYESIGRSIITSLLNLPLSYASYYRSTRRQPKKDDPTTIRDDLHHVAFLFYYLGLLGAVIVRMLSIGLFLGTVSVKFGFIVLAVHFIGNMIFIHFYQKPDFAGLAIAENKCSKFFSVLINTLLYSLVNLVLFVDLNDRTGKKWRILTNNVILYTENFSLVIISFALHENEYSMYYGMVIGLGCVLHSIMLPNFYMFLHPTTGACFNCVDKSTADIVDTDGLQNNDVEAGTSGGTSDTVL